MATKAGPAGVTGGPGDRYFELIRECPLRPLRGEADLDRALAMVEHLGERRAVAGTLTTDESDYLSVLARLIEDYEQVHHPMGAASGPETLRFLMEARGITQAALAAQIGLGPSTVSEIASGKRPMTAQHVARLAKFFGVDPGLFLDLGGS